jgi:hypothetical protein
MLDGQDWLAFPVAGVCSMVFTPLLTRLHTASMTYDVPQDDPIQSGDNIVRFPPKGA